MVAPAQHPNQHHRWECTSSAPPRKRRKPGTLLHCLGYKLFEHSHNAASSFKLTVVLKKRKLGQINSMKGRFTPSQVRDHKSRVVCHCHNGTIHSTAVRIGLRPSFRQHPFLALSDPTPHSRFSAQHSPSELCFLRLQMTTVLQIENKNTYLKVQLKSHYFSEHWFYPNWLSSPKPHQLAGKSVQN